MLTDAEFVAGLAPLMRHWPDGRAFKPDTLADYHLTLQHFDADLLLLAALDVLQTYVYPTFPKPAALFEAGVRALVSRDGHSEQWARHLLSGRAYQFDRLINPPEQQAIEAPANVNELRQVQAKQLMAAVADKRGAK